MSRIFLTAFSVLNEHKSKAQNRKKKLNSTFVFVSLLIKTKWYFRNLFSIGSIWFAEICSHLGKISPSLVFIGTLNILHLLKRMHTLTHMMWIVQCAFYTIQFIHYVSHYTILCFVRSVFFLSFLSSLLLFVLLLGIFKCVYWKM